MAGTASRTLVGALGLAVVVSGCSRDPGNVRVATPGMELKLASGWGKTRTITHASGDVALPAGKYHTQAVRLVAEEPGGAGRRKATWTLRGTDSLGELRSVQVGKDQTTVIKGGPPLAVKVHSRRQGRTVSVDFEIVGQAGEVYEPAARRNGSLQEAPSVRVLDAKGNVLNSGKFQYG